MATLNLQVEADADDCHRRLTASAFTAANPDVNAGAYSATLHQYGCALRFTGITATNFTTAYLIFTGRSAFAGDNCNTRISAEDVDNPGDFSGDNAASFDARYANHTTAIIDWDGISAWSVDEEGADTTSPELKTIFQELYASGHLASEVAVLFWEDFDDRSTQAANCIRQGYGHAGDNAKAVKLHIEYTVAGIGAQYVNISPFGVTIFGGETD